MPIISEMAVSSSTTRMRAFIVRTSVGGEHENMTSSPEQGRASVTDSGSVWHAPGTATPPPVAPLDAPTGAVRDGSAPLDEALRPRQQAWTPPPKRGLVPLRPIPFGTVLGTPFRLQRRAPRTTLAP